MQGVTGARARRSARRDSGDWCAWRATAAALRDRASVCLNTDHSRVFGDVPDLPRHRDLCARHGARMIVPSASLFWSSASPERHAQSLAPSRRPGRASRGPRLTFARRTVAVSDACPLSPRRGGDSGRTRHTTRTGGTESPVTYTFRVAAGFEPPKLLRTRSAPAPAAWPLASGLRRRRGPSGLALAARARRAARRLDAPSTSQFLQYGNMVCHIVWYDLQWHRAVNEQSLRHGCYIHARLRRAFELFDYDNTTLHLPVTTHPVSRRSHRPHTAPPCICIRAEADPSIALRCTAES